MAAQMSGFPGGSDGEEPACSLLFHRKLDMTEWLTLSLFHFSTGVVFLPSLLESIPFFNTSYPLFPAILFTNRHMHTHIRSHTHTQTHSVLTPSEGDPSNEILGWPSDSNSVLHLISNVGEIYRVHGLEESI